MKKILIFSDTHFGSHVDNRLEKLKDLISNYDTVIINGDFWDKYLTTWDEFINSGWSELFPLLKAKHTIYLEGNHDPLKDIDDRYKIFADEFLKSYELNIKNEVVHIEHGNRLFKTIDESYPIVVKFKGLIAVEYKLYDFFCLSGIYNYRKFGKVENRKMFKKYRLENSKNILINGHSHSAEFSIDYKYYNSGLIRYGEFDYIEIIDDKINLVTTTY